MRVLPRPSNVRAGPAAQASVRQRRATGARRGQEHATTGGVSETARAEPTTRGRAPPARTAGAAGMPTAHPRKKRESTRQGGGGDGLQGQRVSARVGEVGQ